MGCNYRRDRIGSISSGIVSQIHRSSNAFVDVSSPRSLSRSGKNILHLDQNTYYGGSEAAFSLDEAHSWMNSVNQRGLPPRVFCIPACC